MESVGHSALTILEQVSSVTAGPLRNLVLLGVAFTLAARLFSSCNPGVAWWRKADLSTDICFALIPRLITAYGETALLVLGLVAFYGISERSEIETFFAHGSGPLSGLPMWQHIGLYLLGSDLVMYLTHRVFHTVHLWRFHAVHHSSEDLEWISSFRFHPVDQILHSGLSDVVMLLLGIPAEVLVWLTPWTVGSSALVHANLDWDFGRFRYVLASPVFHRWHHTSIERGGSSNFAGTFPLFDLLFGTFYMPANQRPDSYGVDEAGYPRHFFGQLAAPFRRKAIRSVHGSAPGGLDHHHGAQLPSSPGPAPRGLAYDGLVPGRRDRT